MAITIDNDGVKGATPLLLLMVGALSIRYVRDNWVETVRRMYDASFIDVTPMLNVYKNGYHEGYILRALRERHYDCMFFYPDAINSDFSDRFFDLVRAGGTPIAAFYADDEPELWYKQNIPYDHRFDVVGTHSLNALKRRQAEGRGDNFIFMPWSFNPLIFNRICSLQSLGRHRSLQSRGSIDEADKLFGVLYVGENLVSRENPQICLRDGRLRQRVLESVYRHSKTHGYSLKVFGPGWDRHPVIRECYAGILSSAEMAEAYNRARIVLNFGFSGDGDDDILSYQTKLRHFEAAGCGAFQLVNQNPEMAGLFPDDAGIAYFGSLDELNDRILYFLTHERIRQEMCDRAYEVAHASHTIQNRLETLFGSVRLRQSQTGGTSKSSPKAHQPKAHQIDKPVIKTIRYDNNEMAMSLLRELSTSEASDSEQAAFHLVPATLECYDINYSLLSASVHPFETAIVGVRTFLQLAYLHHNPLQRKKENITGVMLNEKVNKRRLDTRLLDYIRSTMPVIDDGDYIIPLINLIIPSRHLKAVTAAFVSNDAGIFGLLPCYYSGLILNDMSINSAVKLDFPPPYIVSLERAISNMVMMRQRVLIYGGRGTMADNVIELFNRHNALDVIGIVDRDIKQAQVGRYSIYQYEDIESLRPDVIVITAEYSGHKIYEAIKHLEGTTTILPLYNLSEPVWNVILYDV
ncbi:MAG: glycosyltransferase family 1 protein [Nitrospirae bacterium]|nr:glycosyltransferase family 1 protein [Nitrospirota bacterium]